MMRNSMGCAMAILLLVGVSAASADTLMTFEEFLGHDATPISTFYSGVTFQSGHGGSDWVARDAATGNYNVSSWPSGTVLGGGGQYWNCGFVAATTALDYTGNDGVVGFNNGDATYVELGYSSGNTLYLEAYDTSNALLDSASGPANLRYLNGNENGPGTLRVDAPAGQYISYVYLHDTGNFWCADNIRTDASGIVINNPIPAPGAILLGSIGVSVVTWLRRRRTL